MDGAKIAIINKFENCFDDLIDDLLISEGITVEDIQEYYGVVGSDLEDRIKEKSQQE